MLPKLPYDWCLWNFTYNLLSLKVSYIVPVGIDHFYYVAHVVKSTFLNQISFYYLYLIASGFCPRHWQECSVYQSLLQYPANISWACAGPPPHATVDVFVASLLLWQSYMAHEIGQTPCVWFVSLAASLIQRRHDCTIMCWPANSIGLHFYDITVHWMCTNKQFLW